MTVINGFVEQGGLTRENGQRRFRDAILSGNSTDLETLYSAGVDMNRILTHVAISWARSVKLIRLFRHCQGNHLAALMTAS